MNQAIMAVVFLMSVVFAQVAQSKERVFALYPFGGDNASIKFAGDRACKPGETSSKCPTGRFRSLLYGALETPNGDTERKRFTMKFVDVADKSKVEACFDKAFKVEKGKHVEILAKFLKIEDQENQCFYENTAGGVIQGWRCYVNVYIHEIKSCDIVVD